MVRNNLVPAYTTLSTIRVNYSAACKCYYITTAVTAVSSIACQCTVAIKQYSEAIAITILNDNKQFNIKYWINHFLTATTVYVLWFLF